MFRKPKTPIRRDSKLNTNNKHLSEGWIDVTIPLHEGMASWPESCGFQANFFRSQGSGDKTNDTQLTFDVHLGTHIETSLHHSMDGQEAHTEDLEKIFFDVLILDATSPENLLQRIIDSDVHQAIFFRSENSTRNLYGKGEFDPSYFGLNMEIAEKVINADFHTVGIDYLSIEEFNGDGSVHKTLFNSNFRIIEGLDLRSVTPGIYECIAAPLAIPRIEAIPARVFLRSKE